MAVDCTELQATFAQIADYYVRQGGAKDLDGVVAMIQKKYKDIRREEIADAIVAFHKAPKLNKSDQQKLVEAIRLESRNDQSLRKRNEGLQNLLNDIEAETNPVKKAKMASKAIQLLRNNRDHLADDVRAKKRIDVVKDKLEKMDLSTKAKRSTAQTKWQHERDAMNKKLAEARAENRLDGSIKELERKIDEHDLSPLNPSKNKKTKTPKEWYRDELNKRLAKMRAEANKKPDTRVVDRIAVLRKKIATGDLSSDASPKKATAITRDEHIRNELNAELTELRNDANRKQRLRDQLADLTEQLRTGNFKTPAAKAKKAFDAKTERMMLERDMLKARIKLEIEEMRPFKWHDLAAMPGSMMKMAMTTFDDSYFGRQGIAALLSGHPKIFAKAFRNQFKAIKTDADLFRETKKITDDPLYPVAKRAGLEIAMHMEELEGRAFSTKFGQMIKKYTGAEFADRAFTAAGNDSRWGLFKNYYQLMGGKVTADEAKAIADLVNMMTLRSRMNAGTAVASNKALFSARAMLARWEFLTFKPLRTAPSKRFFKMALKMYAKYVASAIAIGVIAEELGVFGGFDPRSSDFMKIKLGETRIDLMGGMGSYITFLARSLTGDTIPVSGKNKGKVTPIRGPEVKFNGRTWADITFDFTTSKLSPLFSFGAEMFKGEEFGGAPFDVRRALITRGLPLFVQEAYELLKEQGVPEGVILSAIAFFGFGVRNYEGRFGEGNPIGNDIIKLFGGEPNVAEPKKAKPKVKTRTRTRTRN